MSCAARHRLSSRRCACCHVTLHCSVNDIRVRHNDVLTDGRFSLSLLQFNFVGRILGPRGMTAKQLEQETGCKIMVRGRGSMRDKKKVRSAYPLRRRVVSSLS